MMSLVLWSARFDICVVIDRARRTLLIKFADDTLDESPEIEKVLREANTIMRMRCAVG